MFKIYQKCQIYIFYNNYDEFNLNNKFKLNIQMEENVVEIPDEFKKIMKDFYKDILLVFPEYKDKLSVTDIEFLTGGNSGAELFIHCNKVYPERFFDILYKNEDIFKDVSYNTYFLPNIDFKVIWSEDISDKTRETIWKYLQLVLFSVSSGLSSSDSFGETANLFEAIDETELKNKLEEAMKQMTDMFGDISGNNIFSDMSGEKFNDLSNIDMSDLPNPEDLHQHINGLLDGKLGRLAHEIAQETAEGLDVEINEATNVNDVFQKLFKDPGKLISMVKNVGKKLDEKLKSGEIKESELMQEASELMEKMKSMPGMKNMDNILSKMGLPVGGKNGKVNMNAFQSHMKRNIRHATQKERMLKKLEERRKLREQEKLINAQKMQNAQDNKKYTVHSWGETKNVQKTTREEASSRKGKKKKGKGKKKRRKNKNKN